MNTLLIAEHNNETLADATVKSATAAAEKTNMANPVTRGVKPLRRNLTNFMCVFMKAGSESHYKTPGPLTAQ